MHEGNQESTESSTRVRGAARQQQVCHLRDHDDVDICIADSGKDGGGCSRNAHHAGAFHIDESHIVNGGEALHHALVRTLQLLQPRDARPCTTCYIPSLTLHTVPANVHVLKSAYRLCHMVLISTPTP